MVHKNYKWSISIKEGETLVFDTIYDILHEKTDHSIELRELSLILNSRTKDLKLTNNKKQKQLTNFIKSNYGSILYFLENIPEFTSYENNKETYIKLTTNMENDWIFVESDE